MAGVLESGFLFLYDLGFFTTVLPFILLYAILFGLFERVDIFRNSEYHAVLSFCFAFLTIYNVGLVENLNLLFARVGFLFIIIIALLILTGLLGIHGVFASGLTIVVIAVYLGYVVLEIFVKESLLDFINSIIPVDVVFPVLVAGLVFGVIVWFVFGTKTSSKQSSKDDDSMDDVPKPSGSLSKPRFDKQSGLELADDSSGIDVDSSYINKPFEDYLNNYGKKIR